MRPSCCERADPTDRIRPAELRLKRVLDVAFATCALVVLSPVMLLIAVAIRLDSPGSPLFRQVRIGYGGQAFEMLKFRTMRCDAADAAHRRLVAALRASNVLDQAQLSGRRAALCKLVDDPRLTRVGRWLRKSSLDELPQLVNVVRGEMSLVGPRPCPPYQFDEADPWLLERLKMPQGMTGLWQVSGRAKLRYWEMYELDVDYVRRWSLLLDLWILMKTPLAVLRWSATA
jgi:lipopolysaccharide/colanic/teichoic acid biosynthesis glycosyltransferase